MGEGDVECHVIRMSTDAIFVKGNKLIEDPHDYE